MRASREKRTLLPVLTTLVTVLLLLAISVLVLLFSKVTAHYGPPDRLLNLPNRVRYAFLLYRGRDLLGTVPIRQELESKFTIEEGESLPDICQELQDQMFVMSGELICDYLVYSGKDRFIQSGTFTLEANLSAIEISERLTDPQARDITLTIFPGWRAEEIAAQVEQSGYRFTGSDFLTFVNTPPDYVLSLLDLQSGATLEGLLFPGTYSLKPDIKLDEAMAIILTRFVEFADNNDLKARFNENGLSLEQGVTLASIIQRETNDQTEMPLIASVFYNRLKQGMRLETDPTVQYALGYDQTGQTWWKTGLSRTDLGVNSPYNTYLVNGLPPGAISNPSAEALIAAATPAQSDYLFFRAKCDGSGSHNFSVTYEEHLNFGCD